MVDTVLWRRGRVRSPASPFATALATRGAEVVWVGGKDAADGLGADTEVDLADALVTPAFVDAHVHSTATGLALAGLDLAGARSLAAALDAVAGWARDHPGEVLLGTGWDESAWSERRPPTATELDTAAPGALVYLARADVHSAVASPALLAAAHPHALAGFDPGGHVRLDAHHAVRRTAYALLPAAQVTAAQRRARARAVALGIGTLHEMSGPEVAGEADLRSLLALARTEPGPAVVPYWGELGGLDRARDLGVDRVGGDLFCDGALGSHTAALRAPYADAPDTSGVLRYGVEEVTAHVHGCVTAGVQTGFHVIGDAAVETVLAAFEAVAAELGWPRVAAGRHRLEHCELADPAAVARIARLGLVASVQPAFDARWGGPAGLYVDRLGPARAALMNPLAGLAAAGVALALGSDAPVTPLDPWGGVRAAVWHRTAGFGLSARAAFTAATRGGHRAAGDDAGGVLVPGAPATFAVWAAGELGQQAPDDRVARWSTDPRAADAGLPDLSDPDPASWPTCLRTVVAGVTVWTA